MVFGRPSEQPSQAEQIQLITEALANAGEMMEPLIEAAEGQKNKLEARGWSPSAAEMVALEMLMSLVRKAFS